MKITNVAIMKRSDAAHRGGTCWTTIAPALKFDPQKNVDNITNIIAT